MAEYFEFHLNHNRYNSTTPSSKQLSTYLNATTTTAFGTTTKIKFDKNDANDRRKALNQFKDKIGSSMNLILKDKSCYNDDEFLMQFLYARKFNCDMAFELLINYYLYKNKNKSLLNKLTIFNEHIQLALKDGFPSILKERDRRGRKIIVFFTSNWDPQQINLECIYRSLLLSLEKLLDDKQNQSQGFIVIVDWTNFTIKQTKYLSPKILRIMIDGLQDCLPVKFKAVHFISQPWYVEIALNVIKPFFKEKIRQNIYLHGGNLSTLHQLIPKDILPPELGGEGPTLNPLDWYHTLLESSQNIQISKPYRITETTIYSNIPQLISKKTTTTIKSNNITTTTATNNIIHNNCSNNSYCNDKNYEIGITSKLINNDEISIDDVNDDDDDQQMIIDAKVINNTTTETTISNNNNNNCILTPNLIES